MINPEFYSIDLNLYVWILLGVMTLCFILIAILMWPRLCRVRRRVSEDDNATLPDEGYPSVSVIVYSQADGHNLRTLLPQILEQDYPAPMEVIVVNDESADNTETIVSEMELRYSNLYMTFAPERSRNLSRRKLSITLGIKAARYDALLLTCGNCQVTSPQWMRRMMRHMVEGKEVVIGYAESYGNDEPDKDRRYRRRAFDNVWDAIRYLSKAIRRRPFMGNGYNLAYTRRLFFEHKGFSQTLHLAYGDDDMFVNEISTPDNTAVELSHDSRVIAHEYSPAELHDIYRLRRDFTARMLPRSSYLSMGFTSVLWWIWPACAGVAIWLGLPSLVPALIVAVLSLTFCLIHSSIWRKCSKAIGSRSLFWTVPWMALSRPFRTWRHRLQGRKTHRHQLTHVI